MPDHTWRLSQEVDPARRSPGAQRRDTPNCPSTRREDVHGAVAQRKWYFLPGQALPWAMDPARGLHDLLRPEIAQRGRGEVSALGGTVGTSSPQPSGVRTLALERRRPPAGLVCGLALVEGFDDGRFLTPLGVLDRNEPPGFGVSAHLKGLGRLPHGLGCFCFPFRHVRSPPKRVSTMLTGYDAPSR